MIIIDNQTTYSDILAKLNKDSFKDIFLLIDVLLSNEYIKDNPLDSYYNDRYVIDMSYDTDDGRFKPHTDNSKTRLCKTRVKLTDAKYMRHYNKFTLGEITRDTMIDNIYKRMVSDITRSINKQLVSEIKREFNDIDIFESYLKKEVSYSELMSVNTPILAKSICDKLTKAHRNYRTAYPATIKIAADIINDDILKDIFSLNESFGIDLILEKYETNELYNKVKQFITDEKNNHLDQFVTAFGTYDDILDRIKYRVSWGNKTGNTLFDIFESCKAVNTHSYWGFTDFIKQHVENKHTTKELFILYMNTIGEDEKD